jgi:hypothetical protein
VARVHTLLRSFLLIMARTLCIPASVLLLVALVLSLLVSLSLPFLPTLDIVRVLVADNGAQASLETMNNIRVPMSDFICDSLSDGRCFHFYYSARHMVRKTVLIKEITTLNIFAGRLAHMLLTVPMHVENKVFTSFIQQRERAQTDSIELGYEVIFVNIFNTADFEIIQPSWTRGLVVHTIGTPL